MRNIWKTVLITYDYLSFFKVSKTRCQQTVCRHWTECINPEFCIFGYFTALVDKMSCGNLRTRLEMKEIIIIIFEKNPGLMNILLTTVLLPIAILWLTNRNNRKLKETEKEIESKYKAKDNIREQERKVYASLSKILFDVQQLYVSLSGNCVNTDCVSNALNKLDNSISECHSTISDNLLYLSSNSIDLIYGFYNTIGKLKIQLQKLDKEKKYDLAHVTVFCLSKDLAEILIKIQELFISQRNDLQIEFDKLKQEQMKCCCGQEPSKELMEKFQKFQQSMIEQELN